MKFLTLRLADKKDIVLVFGTAAFFVYNWSILNFFNQVPSLLLRIGLGDIFERFFDSMAAALLESLLTTGGLILLGLILPAKWFKQGFGYKGFLTILAAAGGMIWLRHLLGNNYFPAWKVLYMGIAMICVAWIGLLLLFHNARKLQNIVLIIADRLEILTYLYIPLGIIGLLQIFLQSLF